jgi:hypothetical protein
VDLTHTIVHVGYSLMLVALVARDVLWLRAILVAAQFCIGLYAWRIGVPSIAAWNGLFVVLNAVWVSRILRERRAVTLPEDLRAIYTQHFAALAPPEFLRFWQQGTRRTLVDARLTQAGAYPESLFFVLAGAARVTRDGGTITELPAGYFVGEMSLLTGDPANADVHAVGALEVISWPVADLRELRARDPARWSRLQSVIGHDIVAKIQRGQPGSR